MIWTKFFLWLRHFDYVVPFRDIQHAIYDEGWFLVKSGDFNNYDQIDQTYATRHVSQLKRVALFTIRKKSFCYKTIIRVSIRTCITLFSIHDLIIVKARM